MTSPDRTLALSVIALLIVGFAYSAVATIRLDRVWLSSSMNTQPNATIDANLSIAGIHDAESLRRAVRDAGWPPNEDVVVVGAASALSANELTQVHFSTSYLLFPRRVWAATWCDERAGHAECQERHAVTGLSEAMSERPARHVLLVSNSDPKVRAASVRPISPRARLVDLQ